MLRAVFPSWQHRRACPVLPEQLLREGDRPQTINYSVAPLHTPTGAVEILCTYTHAHVRGGRERGDVGWPTPPSLLIPGHPSELRKTPETGF